MLSADQLAAYRRDGIVMVENVADEAMLAAMRRALADLIAKSASVTQHDDIYDLEPDHTPENPRLRRIKQPHLHHPVFSAFRTSEPLLGILKQLLGPNIRM